MRCPAPVCWITHFEQRNAVSLSHRYLIFLFGCLKQDSDLGIDKWGYLTFEPVLAT
jgi:hypothetical protein